MLNPVKLETTQPSQTFSKTLMPVEFKLFLLLVSLCYSIPKQPSWGFFNPFPNKPWFLRVSCKSLLKTLWEMEKLLVTSNFSFSHSVSYPFEELSSFFIKFEIVICKLFQFERDLNLSFEKV